MSLDLKVEEPSSTYFTGNAPVIKFGTTIDNVVVDQLLPEGTGIQTQISATNQLVILYQDYVCLTLSHPVVVQDLMGKCMV